MIPKYLYEVSLTGSHLSMVPNEVAEAIRGLMATKDTHYVFKVLRESVEVLDGFSGEWAWLSDILLNAGGKVSSWEAERRGGDMWWQPDRYSLQLRLRSTPIPDYEEVKMFERNYKEALTAALNPGLGRTKVLAAMDRQTSYLQSLLYIQEEDYKMRRMPRSTETELNEYLSAADRVTKLRRLLLDCGQP